MAAKQKSKAKGGNVVEAVKSRGAQPSESQAEVQRCWEEYWARRRELEAAVTLVKDAQLALEDARKREADLRHGFDEAKMALKQLLDVEPADVSETAQPSPRFN